MRAYDWTANPLRAPSGWPQSLRTALGTLLAHLPMFALTGYGQQEDRERSLRVGFARYFVKPIDIEELDAALGSVDEPLEPARTPARTRKLLAGLFAFFLASR